MCGISLEMHVRHHISSNYRAHLQGSTGISSRKGSVLALIPRISTRKRGSPTSICRCELISCLFLIPSLSCPWLRPITIKIFISLSFLLTNLYLLYLLLFPIFIFMIVTHSFSRHTNPLFPFHLLPFLTFQSSTIIVIFAILCDIFFCGNSPYHVLTKSRCVVFFASSVAH